MNFYKNKKVLVAGGTGLIGRPLVELLLKEGAEVKISSLDDPSRANPQAKFERRDLTDYYQCKEVCNDMDIVFNLLGVKGSPKMTAEKPASFFVPMILFNTNMMKAAKESRVERYLYTSTIGVYSPAEVFREDDVWKTFPSKNDRFGGWAKRMGELQAEAYRIEYGWDKVSIVRPANVYGPYDNFDPESSMVIPSLIRRAVDGDNPFIVWGDGSSIRDFIHAKDVARGMMKVIESNYTQPVNIGSGRGYTIRELTEMIINNLKYKPDIVWDTTKPAGDHKRVMDTSRITSLGWSPKVSLEEGIEEVMKWYTQNKEIIDRRYNVFEK